MHIDDPGVPARAAQPAAAPLADEVVDREHHPRRAALGGEAVHDPPGLRATDAVDSQDRVARRPAGAARDRRSRRGARGRLGHGFLGFRAGATLAGYAYHGQVGEVGDVSLRYCFDPERHPDMPYQNNSKDIRRKLVGITTDC